MKTLLTLISFPYLLFGYLDPGTGSLLLQGLIATIATSMGVASLYWHKIKSLFSSKKDKDNTDSK